MAAKKINTRITITEYEDGTFSCHRNQGELTFSKALDYALTVLNGVVKELRTALAADEKLTEEEKEKTIRELFDIANISFSRSLELNFPEVELHPEMSDDVLKRAIEIETKRARRKAHRLAKNSGKGIVIPIDQAK